jgi:diaminopimelate decarboxylase
MSFTYRDGVLCGEQVELAAIARREGTPCYVYSAAAIRARYLEYDRAFGSLPHSIHYAVKANANLAVLHLLAGLGAGFDIVSGGELYRVLRAGGDSGKVVFSGVGKTAAEIEYALREGIFGFHCESEGELALLDALAARAGVKARIALRVNPDVDAATHPYISTGLAEHKFGIAIAEVEELYERAARFPHLAAESVSCHIGSQILDPAPVYEAVEKMVALAGRLRARGLPIRQLDLGGGLGVAYRPHEITPSVTEFVRELARRAAGTGLKVMLEPGRSIVAEAGVLLTRVLYRKTSGRKEFVIVDAAMNDLLRPALYQAHHEILPLRESGRPPIRADVVGPVCESGDFLAKAREIADVLPGDFVAVMTAGAYGFALASNYNARPRPAEVLIDGESWRVVRARESFADLLRGEAV